VRTKTCAASESLPCLNLSFLIYITLFIWYSRTPGKPKAGTDSQEDFDRLLRGGFMLTRTIVVLSALCLLFVFAPLTLSFSAAQEDTIVGVVVKHGKQFIIEADEGDYIVKGKDLTNMTGKMVEVTGTITESEKGDTIEVKSVEEIQE
jgi:hypothetical protein